MLRTLSLVEWEIRSVFSYTAAFRRAFKTSIAGSPDCCRTARANLWGQPTQPSNIAKRVLRPSANSGFVKIAFAMSVSPYRPNSSRRTPRVRHPADPPSFSIFFKCTLLELSIVEQISLWHDCNDKDFFCSTPISEFRRNHPHGRQPCASLDGYYCLELSLAAWRAAYSVR
jgi:hypothetical protein